MSGVSGAGADEWGSLKGQVVVTGDLPDLPPLFKKSAQVKDTAICGVMDMPDESLVFDPAGRGLANVFVYLKDSPPRIHPDRIAPPKEPAVLMVQNCRFFPHALVMRAGQTLDMRAQQGEIAHTTHFTMLANFHPLALLQDTNRWTPSKPESLPVPVRCDIHPWMRTNVLIKDHPYTAVTDATGRFEIKDLPTGEQTFRVWHERPGYVVREWKVTIAAGKTLGSPVIEVPAERLKER